MREATERETAIAEILEAMSRSPTDVSPVLDTISRNGARICSAEFAGVMLLEDGKLVPHQAVRRGVATSSRRGQPFAPEGSVSGRAMQELRTIHVADILATDEYP